MIDDTRTQGEKTSFNNMFEAIERIKNCHVVSTMYGRYAEVIYNRPQIIFFTNRGYHMKLTIQLRVKNPQLKKMREQMGICFSQKSLTKITKIMIISILHYFIIKFNIQHFS